MVGVSGRESLVTEVTLMEGLELCSEPGRSGTALRTGLEREADSEVEVVGSGRRLDSTTSTGIRGDVKVRKPLCEAREASSGRDEGLESARFSSKSKRGVEARSV